MPADHCRAPQECDLRFVLSMEPGDVNQHDLVYFFINMGLVIFYPCQFACSKISWRIQQML